MLFKHWGHGFFNASALITILRCLETTELSYNALGSLPNTRKPIANTVNRCSSPLPRQHQKYHQVKFVHF